MISDGSNLIVFAKDNSYPQMLNLDQNGNVIFSKTFNTNDYRHIYAAKQTPDGDIFIAGYVLDTEIAGNWLNGAYITKLDALGNIIWSRILHSTSTWHLNINDFAIDDSNQIWVAAEMDGSPILLEMNSNGTIASKYKSTLQSIATFSSKICISSNGQKFWSAGETDGLSYVYQFDTPALLCQSTSSFNVQNATDAPMLNSIASNNYQALTSNVTATNLVVNMASATSNRNLECQAVGILPNDMIENRILVYPNPTSDLLFFTQLPNDFLSLIIYDVSGREVASFQISDLSSGSINVEGMSGLMFFEFRGIHKNEIHKILVR
jgi:hypothetical protein